MKKLVILFLGLLFNLNLAFSQNALNIIVIGAHPDDCDSDAGGTAALLAAAGYNVKFLSVTNGDAGHQDKGGGALARIRYAEALEAGRRLGIAEYKVLDNHDGELVPSLDVRQQIIREIRKWDADVVIAPRPNDYHPDHRYTGVLVQDAAYMVAVPNVTPDTPPLKKNPVFLYSWDHFQRPNPFRADVAIDIGEVYAKKIDALDAHVSQVYEWLPWIGGYLNEVPSGAKERKEWLAKQYPGRITQDTRKALAKWYGKDRATIVKYAEAFEICEYGKQPSDQELRQIFPMLK